jgi:hypothetical protein
MLKLDNLLILIRIFYVFNNAISLTEYFISINTYG